MYMKNNTLHDALTAPFLLGGAIGAWDKDETCETEVCEVEVAMVPSGGTLSLLIVEDDGYTRELLVKMIVSRSPDVVICTADNGRSGLDQFMLHFPDVVITDIAMPVMAGMCMATGIKALKPDAVIIAVTAHTDTADLLKAIEIGIDHYLLKPLCMEKLFILIDKVIASKTVMLNRKRSEETLRVTEQRHKDELKLVNELLEQRVRERTAELEAAVRDLESFSYSVSHDLRAPLRHINCFSAMLLEDFRSVLPEAARDYVDKIGEASSRMGALIDHLLELSRVVRVETKPVRVNLSKLAQSVLGMLQETEPKRRVELFVEDGITVWGDKFLLRQLLENLLGNAWKYTSKKESACIEFGRTQMAGQETFFIRDDGAGFNMTYQNRLFEVFQRLHGAEFEGLGIGLATAHRIIQRHGGNIWAEAREEKGATFYFTLPRKQRDDHGKFSRLPERNMAGPQVKVPSGSRGSFGRK